VTQKFDMCITSSTKEMTQRMYRDN